MAMTVAHQTMFDTLLEAYGLQGMINALSTSGGGGGGGGSKSASTDDKKKQKAQKQNLTW